MAGLLTLARSRPAAAPETAQVSKPAATAPTSSAPSTVGSVAATPTTLPSTTVITLPPATSVMAPTTLSTHPDRAAGPTYVAFDGVRYRIDGGHRRHAIGDWDCDGSATLATLDPATGALTFFQTWPETGSTQAVSTDHVPGAIDLRAEPTGGCDQLTIVHANGVDTYDTTGDSS
jgi:hypothetical protein